MRSILGVFRKVWFWALLINLLYLPPYYIGGLTLEKFFLTKFVENWEGTSFLAVIIITINQISNLVQSGFFVRLAEAGKKKLYITLVAWGVLVQTILLFSLACVGLACLVLFIYSNEVATIFPEIIRQLFFSDIKLVFDVCYLSTIVVPIVLLLNGRFGVLLAIIQITLLEGLSRLLQYLFPETITDDVARYFPQNFYGKFDLNMTNSTYLLGVLGYLFLFFVLSVLASNNLLKVKKV